MLKTLKQFVLRTARGLGMSRLLLDSSWRSQRLLILCYHGIAMEDECRFDPNLYMEPGLLRRRFELLRENGCQVLPLGDAITRLYSGELPPRAVAITVDDGTYDFYRLGLPLLREFNFPATIYVTTYYSGFNRPVFDAALSYILWKSGGAELKWPEVIESPVRLDAAGRAEARRKIEQFALRNGLTGPQKDDLLSDLAGHVGFDYPALCAKRMFSIMTGREIQEASAAGIDIELHTHRHKLYRQADRFQRELEDNRRCLESLTHVRPVHFCYPSGYHEDSFLPWLRKGGIESAVTCVPGLAERHSDPLLLPRLVDVSALSEIEFAGWLCGLGALLPARTHAMDRHSLVD